MWLSATDFNISSFYESAKAMSGMDSYSKRVELEAATNLRFLDGIVLKNEIKCPVLETYCRF